MSTPRIIYLYGGLENLDCFTADYWGILAIIAGNIFVFLGKNDKGDKIIKSHSF